jgi:hypothetical protein
LRAAIVVDAEVVKEAVSVMVGDRDNRIDWCLPWQKLNFGLIAPKSIELVASGKK